jgi:hypothetical protein
VLAKAGPGIRFNEHIEGDGPTVFAHACKLGLEGIVSKRKEFRLPFRPLARLAQNEELGCTCGEAGGGRELAPLTYLMLKRASANRPSGEWNDEDYDVLADGIVVGRIMKAAAVPVGQSWMWTLAFGHHEDRTPTHGYAAFAPAGSLVDASSCF